MKMKKKFTISFEVVKEVQTSGPDNNELKHDDKGMLKRMGSEFLSGVFSGLGRVLVTGGSTIPWDYLIHLYNSLFG